MYSGLAAGKHSTSEGQGLTMRVEIVPQTGMIVLEPHGSHPERPSHPPARPAPGQQLTITRVETVGIYPEGFKSPNHGAQCINMSPFEGHLRAPTTHKSYVVERNGITVVVDILEVKKHDHSRRRSLCNANRGPCREVTDWMALKVNGTVMYLHAQEAKRLEFTNGAALLLAALTINDHTAKEGSAVCWDYCQKVLPRKSVSRIMRETDESVINARIFWSSGSRLMSTPKSHR